MIKIMGFLPNATVGWVNSDATRYIFAIQDTRSTEDINIIEVYNIETKIEYIPELSNWSTVLLVLVLATLLCILKKHPFTKQVKTNIHMSES